MIAPYWRLYAAKNEEGVADAFGEMAEAAGELADAVTREDRTAEPIRAHDVA